MGSSLQYSKANKDELVREKLFKDSSIIFKIAFLVPVLISFLTFNYYRRLVEFTVQLRLNLIVMIIVSCIFYSLVVNRTNALSLNATRFVASFLIILEVTFTMFYTVLSHNQITVVRFAFVFTIAEMACFSMGYHITFSLYFVSLVWTSLAEKEPQVEDAALVYALINLFLYVGAYFLNREYIKRYINRDDDLIGETDMLRRIIKDRKDPVSIYTYINLAKELALLVALCLLNFSLNSAASKFFEWQFTSTGKTPVLSKCIVLLISNVLELVGSGVCLKVQLSKPAQIVFCTILPRLAIIGVLFVASQYDRRWFENKIALILVVSVFYFVNGFGKIQLFSMAAKRVEDKQKKNVGFLMMFAMCFGILYGDLTCISIFKNY